MSGSVGSVIFLAIIVLVPLGMVSAIVTVIVRNARGRSAARAAARGLGWDDAHEREVELRALLEPTIFAMRKGRHDLRSVAGGTVNGVPCWIAEYHYRAPGANPETRRGGTYSILTLKMQSGADRLTIQHRQTGRLASLAEKLAGDRVEPARQPDWEWALVSSSAGLNNLPLHSKAGEELGSVTRPGDTVFLFPDLAIWSRASGLSREWAEDVPKMIRLLQSEFAR